MRLKHLRGGCAILAMCAIMGVPTSNWSALQAQETDALAEATAPDKAQVEARGVEKSDIRRGQSELVDVDEDGLADAYPDVSSDKSRAPNALAEALGSEGPADDGTQPDVQSVADVGNAVKSDGDASTLQQRKKMKKLKPTEVTMEPMEEIDGCPTLPCGGGQ